MERTLYSLDDSAPQRPTARQSERQLTLLRVGALLIGDRRELCLIRNISAGGMMIRAYSPMPPGTRLSVELKQGEPVAGTVQWAEDGYVGLAFDSAIDVVSLISAPSDGLKPRTPRIEINCATSVRQGAIVHRTRTVNVSQSGICVETKAELPVGAEVIVTLPSLPPQQAMVKWRNGEACGIGFTRPLPLAQLVDWLQQQKRGSRAGVA